MRGIGLPVKFPPFPAREHRDSLSLGFCVQGSAEAAYPEGQITRLLGAWLEGNSN